MALLKKMMTRLKATFSHQRFEAEMDEEMRSHIELRTQQKIDAGQDPKEARYAALRQFGWTESIKETCREQRGVRWLETLAQDIRFGARQLRKTPGFTAVAVLTLAVGIGACAAIFSLVHAVLLRPLPFRNPETLVWIENIDPSDLSGRTTWMETFLAWRSEKTSVAELAAYNAFFDQAQYTLIGKDSARKLRGVPVSKNFLSLLGVRPMLGRDFNDEDCLVNGRKTVILSHSFWLEHFGGDTNMAGRSIVLKDGAAEIAGVLPAAFDFSSIFCPGTKVDVLVPLPISKELSYIGNMLFAVGRLKPGSTVRQAQAEFDAINLRFAKEHPNMYAFGARISYLETSIRGAFRQPMILLFAAVCCVLLIACVNLSNLLLARANGRRKEFAVRAALGATRWRIIRQSLTESLLLSLLGCALGVLFSFAAAAGLARMRTFNIPLMHLTSVDTTVLVFTVAISGLAGLLTGTLPALQLAGGNTQEQLNAANSRGAVGVAGALVRRGLVVSEIAVACVLLVGAGLLIESFNKILGLNLGFQPRQAVTWRLNPSHAFKSFAEKHQYYDRLVSLVTAIPGVESAGLSDALPLVPSRSWNVGAIGVNYEKDQKPVVLPRVVDYRYLQTMRIPLRAGRCFDAGDTANTEKSIIINETLARRLWPDKDAIGQIAEVNGGSRVIGVVGDVRQEKIEAPDCAEIYLNYCQCDDWSGLDLVVRGTRAVASLTADVRAVMKVFDPALPNGEFTTLEEIVDRAVAPRKLITGLLGAFSTLALTLSAIGLYGVIAYSTGQRTKEIGIRMAVGAQRRDVMGLIVGDGFKMALAGVVIGLILSLLLTRVLKGLLFGVTATDPWIFVTIAAVIVVVALLACALPADRASRVDPMEALRNE